MRRLPVYLLIDTSGSMKGEPIESVNVGLRTLLASLRQDPSALESVHLSIITFDRVAKVICPMESVESFQSPTIQTPDSGPTHTGEALALLCRQYDSEILQSTPDQKGDWKPLLFLMTDGSPSDNAKYQEMLLEVKKRKFGVIIGCAAGPHARTDSLAAFADHVFHLDTADQSLFGIVNPFWEAIRSAVLMLTGRRWSCLQQRKERMTLRA
ncbi:MAG: VWA domain-containing protein [bacterium]|nr:VWA domain-containing protein [bacterium]